MGTKYYRVTILALFSFWAALGVNSATAAFFPLLTVTNSWRYNQSGDDLGNAWRAPAYDDTLPGWEGPSNMLFGFETTPGVYLPFTFQTQFQDPSNVVPYVITYYFRTHCSFPDVPPILLAGASLISTNAIDDGVIYYLNGVEWFRFNMPDGPADASTFSFQRFTFEGWPPMGNTVFFRTNLATNFLVGDNVIAAEVHQGNTNSSDEVFGMTLTLYVPDPVVITSQPTGAATFQGAAPITLSVGVTGETPYYQWLANGVKIPNATSSVLKAPTTAMGTTNYQVV